MDPNDYQGIKKYKGRGKDFIAPGYGYHHMGEDPNIYSNAVVETVEYHIYTFPIFRDILDASGPKGNYGGWLKFNIIGFPPLNNFSYHFINLGFIFICRLFISFGISS